jgi:hypothetical protein
MVRRSSLLGVESEQGIFSSAARAWNASEEEMKAGPAADVALRSPRPLIERGRHA